MKYRHFALNEVYPNPFNPVTTVTYEIPEDGFVEPVVYDMLGNEVTRRVNEVRTAGTHQTSWNAGQLSSGIYFLLLTAGDYTAQRKLVFLK